MSGLSRWLVVLALAGTLALTRFAPADAEPDATAQDWQARQLAAAGLPRDGLVDSVPAPDQALDQRRRGAGCSDVPSIFRNLDLPDLGFVLSDADLQAGDGSRLCVFRDEPAQRYAAFFINQRSADELRADKATLLPLLADAGVDPCQVAFWSPTDADVFKQTDGNDWHDAGRVCEPQIFTHGPKSEARAGQLRASLAAARTKAEELFGWSLTWPLEIHAWDDHDSFTGGAVEAGVPAGRVGKESGIAYVSSARMPVILLDLSKFPGPTDMQVLVAHEYAHIVQHGVTGCTCTLPFFSAEGGADFFASLIAGPAQGQLAAEFQEAKEQVRAGTATPLGRLMDKSSNDQAYSRGYAAMQFLADRWGADAYTRLYLDNRGGSPRGYLDNLARITGLDLDTFDAALSEYLRTQPGFAPPAGPATTLPAGSRLLRLFTSRHSDENADDEATRFTRADGTVWVRLDWDCIDDRTPVEIYIFQPSGERFARYGGDLRPGCRTRTGLEFGLDDGRGGKTARAFPGRWKAEVYLAGVLQGAVTFTIEP